MWQIYISTESVLSACLALYTTCASVFVSSLSNLPATRFDYTYYTVAHKCSMRQLFAIPASYENKHRPSETGRSLYTCSNVSSFSHIEGSRPEWCISSMMYSRDTTLWSETLDIALVSHGKYARLKVMLEEKFPVYLGAGSAETAAVAATPRYKLQLSIAASCGQCTDARPTSSSTDPVWPGCRWLATGVQF